MITIFTGFFWAFGRNYMVRCHGTQDTPVPYDHVCWAFWETSEDWLRAVRRKRQTLGRTCKNRSLARN